MMRQGRERYQNYGYQNRYPDQDYGYQNRYPDQDYGYQDRYPDQNYGYQDRYPDQDYGYQDRYPSGPGQYPNENYMNQEPYQDGFEDARYDTQADLYDGYDEDYGETDQDGARTGTAFSSAGILKFAAAFLILVYIALLLIYASGSTKPFEEVAAAVEEQLDTEILEKQDAQALKRYYGLNGADYEGVLFYSAEFSISAEEVLLIEVKSEQQVQEVRDAMEERLESRKHTFEGYAPEQAQLIEQAQLQARGRFVFLAVSSEAEKYVSAFTNGL